MFGIMYDVNKNQTPQEALAAATALFLARTGQLPNTLFLHPDAPAPTTTLEVKRTKLVLPGALCTGF